MIGAFSRHVFTETVIDPAGRTGLSRRAPYRFRERADTRLHIVQEGETLLSLAHAYFSPLPRPSGFWWAIADFQPRPITDPTLRLEAGSKIYIPAVAVLTDVILGERRRREH